MNICLGFDSCENLISSKNHLDTKAKPAQPKQAERASFKIATAGGEGAYPVKQILIGAFDGQCGGLRTLVRCHRAATSQVCTVILGNRGVQTELEMKDLDRTEPN